MSCLYALLPSLARFADVPQMRRRLARGDRLPAGGRHELAPASCFHWPGTGLPAAALVREYLCGDAGGDVWLCADPGYARPDMTSARLLACGTLAVEAAEAEALARPLRPLFGDRGMHLETSLPGRWHLRLPPGAPLPAFDPPGEVLGDDLLEHLPEGEAGRGWRQLFNEAQILLHQQACNRERARQGKKAVNSVWFWGGGKLPAWVTGEVGRVHADALLPVALARRAGTETQPLSAFDTDARLPGSTLVDLRAATVPEACAELLFGVLDRRRADTLVLHFVGGERWRIRRFHRWRLWRGTR